MSLAAMDNMGTDMRILQRILQETGGGIRRTGWMNLVIIVTMASILTIFGVLFSVVIEAQLFVDNIGSGMKISVYAKPGTDIDQLRNQIKELPNIRQIELVPREQAWEDMKKNYQVPDIENPLPDTLHIQLTDQRYIEDTVSRIKAMASVEEVNYARSIINRLKSVSRYTFLVGMAVSIFFGVLTLFVISNTIHLLIQARSREIEIMRMMGVGNWYIRMPFLLQGAAYGLAGACIAYIPLSVAEYYISQLFQYFQFSTNSYSLSIVLTLLVLMGIFVGAGGAAMSVHRYLKV
jgi:cell division transport system permease protein